MATFNTAAEYQAQMAIYLANNTNEEISEADVRQSFTDLSDSVAFKGTAQTITGIWTHTAVVKGVTPVADADLTTKLYVDSTFALTSHTHAASDITSGTMADARIAESNVTQHQAALSITESQISDLGTYQPTSEKGAANGYAPLDSGAKIAESYLPDSILGQVEYQGTWDAATNTPAIPAASSANKGHYYIASSDVSSGHGYSNVPNVDFQTGDWIISNGSSWAKVDNTDAVSTVFGRTGAIVANESDYQTYYPRLSQTYANPSWISALAASKLTGQVAIANGGTGASTASTARTNLGLGTLATYNTDGLSVNLIMTGTGAIQVPSGTTAQAPTASNGMFRYDTTEAKLKGVEGGDWKNLITGGVGETIAVNQIAFGNSSGDVVGSTQFTYNSASRYLYMGGGGASARISMYGSTTSTHLDLSSDGSDIGYTGPSLRGFSNVSASEALNIISRIDTTYDTGTEAAINIIAYRESGLAIGTRPIAAIKNYTTKLWEMANDGTQDYQGNDLTEVANLTRTGLLTIDATTGVDLAYNGTTQLSVESGLVEVQNDLSVLGILSAGGASNGTAELQAINTSGVPYISIVREGNKFWGISVSSTGSLAHQYGTTYAGMTSSTSLLTISSTGVITASNYSGTGTEDAQFTSTGALTRVTSDERTKDIIGKLDAGLDFVLAAAQHTIEYDYKDPNKLGLNAKGYHNWGFGARAVTAAYGKNPVFRIPDGSDPEKETYSWDQKQMIAPLYNAIAQLHQQIEEIKSQLN